MIYLNEFHRIKYTFGKAANIFTVLLDVRLMLHKQAQLKVSRRCRQRQRVKTGCHFNMDATMHFLYKLHELLSN